MKKSSRYIKPIIGVFIMGATLLSFSYIANYGTEKEFTFVYQDELSKYKQENIALQKQVQDLSQTNQGLGQELDDTKKSELKLKQDYDALAALINNKNINIAEEHQLCLASQIPLDDDTYSVEDRDKYKNTLKNKSQEVRRFMGTSAPFYAYRYIQLYSVDGDELYFNIGEMTTTEIKPLCKAQFTETFRVKMNSKTQRVDTVN